MRLNGSKCGAVLVGLLPMLMSSAMCVRASAKSGVDTNHAQYELFSSEATDAFTAKTGGQRLGTEESGWHKLDAVAFSVFAPLGWTFHQLPGVDSYVGEFVGDGVVLRFDFGRHSNPLKEEKKPTYAVLHKSIGGLRAKVVSPKTPGRGITGVHFPRTFGSNTLSLFGKDLTSTQQELALKIFETIRFGRTVPPILPAPAENVQ